MSAAIAVERLSVARGGRTVLHDVSFAIERGAFVGIIGSNGAGKTTLLRTLLGLVGVSAGSVRVLERPVRRGNRAIGYVAQRTTLDPDLPLRARDFVAFGLDGERWGFAWPSAARRARIDAALAAVGAEPYAEARVGRLSGGEQQRLFIAQALLAEPRILLLDEPLANLDLRSAGEIVRLVARIRRDFGVTVLFVTHDINPLVDVMDRVVYLAAGRAVAGSVDEVVRTEVLSALYGYRVDVLRVDDRVVVLAGETPAPVPLSA
ncbi:MAG TPA: ATP-binding cassette domain-containing protein [Candidatus Limnocylindria bacterium]|nr:ATP-binding cassette domain-containing protein [Candidatus Limnocylindria bacterium]